MGAREAKRVQNKSMRKANRTSLEDEQRPIPIAVRTLNRLRSLPPSISAGYCFDFARGEGPPRHAHRHGQLVFAPTDLVTIEAVDELWLATPRHAVWIPPRVPHHVRAAGARQMRNLYVAPRLAGKLPAEPACLAVSGLLREALLRLCGGETTTPSSSASRLLAVVIDELRLAADARPEPPLVVPGVLHDPKLRVVAEALMSNPLDARNLSAWAAELGTSRRTLTRIVRVETGRNWREWRLQLRLTEGLRRLMSGTAVKTVAFDLGYAGPTPFIAAFTRAFGTSPGQVFSGDKAVARNAPRHFRR